MSAPKTRRRWWRGPRARRVFGALAAVLVLSLVGVLIQAWEGLGSRSTGARLLRMQRSPEWRDGVFVNPEPIVNVGSEMFGAMLHWSEDAAPNGEVRFVRPAPEALAKPPQSGLRITWFGHSSSLIEIDGKRLLTDPMWSERAGPLSWIGPRRFFPVLIALDALGPIDAVLISHDHYDHLDHRTVQAMRDFHGTRFIVPLGVGAHLEYWGIPSERIQEVDWWDEVALGDVRIASTPARHASGRHLFDRDKKLWSSYAVVGPKHRVYFSGDTGLFSALETIRKKYAPFDVTLFEVGQYHRAWPDWHLGPEQAVLAHQKVGGRLFFPLHWALLSLAPHAWTEPMERALSASRARGVPVLSPMPGQSIEPELSASSPKSWWPTVPFETAQQHPVVSGNVHFEN